MEEGIVMPKAPLKEEDRILESQMIATMLESFHNWRPDLNYPESHSDMESCVRGLMRMFEIKRRPLVVPLRIKCDACEGLGYRITKSDENGSIRTEESCKTCRRRRWVEG